MSKKYTIDSIKNLKTKVKELDESLLKHYTQKGFIPNDSFRLFTEEGNFPQINEDVVNKMVSTIDKYGKDNEFEAGKILFEHLDQMSPKQASDIGFWTFHNHNTFYPYIVKRWSDLWNPDKNTTNPSNYIINHWIQSDSSQQGLIKYPISGLWWSFYLTIDENREDKYELTKVFFKNYSLRVIQMGQTRFARYKPATLAVLEFIKENYPDYKSLEEATRAIIPYVNLLGGIRPLTYFNKEWFKKKLESKFSAKISAGEKLFQRPNETSNFNQNETNIDLLTKESQIKDFDRYFCLNSETGSYKVTSRREENWDYCLGLDFEIENQFLIHFYKEGKIKKSKVDGSLFIKSVDRPIPYSNGKNKKLTLCNLKLINQPVLFGIAYKIRTGVYFKAMDEQCEQNFRIDNSNLNQEGKKVLYIYEPFQSSYKILPYHIKDELGSLVQKSPSAGGAEITNNYYKDKWDALKPYWPELFDESIEWN